MSKPAASLTGQQSRIATTLVGGVSLMPKIGRERLWVRCVEQLRISRGAEKKYMATPNPKKSVLQSAAADTYSKAGAEMKQAEPLLAKADVSASKPSKAGRADDKGRKAR